MNWLFCLLLIHGLLTGAQRIHKRLNYGPDDVAHQAIQAKSKEYIDRPYRHFRGRALVNFLADGSSNGGLGHNTPPQEAESPQVLSVQTAQELQVAVVRGQPYIELTEHLDLSSIPRLKMKNSKLTSLLGSIPPEVLSLRGRCESPPPPEMLQGLTEPPMLPFKPGQCLILSPTDLLFVREGRLWLEGLYIRASRNSTSAESINLVTVSDPPAPQLWLSNITLQGDGGVSATGIYVASAMAAMRTVVADFGSGQPAVNVLLDNSTACFDACTFLRNEGKLGTIAASSGSAAIKIQHSVFQNNSQPMFVDSGSALWFTDTPYEVQVLSDTDLQSKSSEPLSSVPSNISFLPPNDSWFQTVVRESNTGPKAALVVEQESRTTSSLSPAFIVGVCVASLVPLVVTGALLVWRWRTHHSSSASQISLQDPLAARSSPFGHTATSKRSNVEGSTSHLECVRAANATTLCSSEPSDQLSSEFNYSGSHAFR